MPRPTPNLIGKVFDRLTVVGREVVSNRSYWKCNCECGNTVTLRNENVKRTKSCGCLNRELATTRARCRKKHGLSNTPEYSTWVKMHNRCKDKKDSKFKDYGARGIKICKRWDNFENFYKDMGSRPENTTNLERDFSIERINNDGPYSPLNCRWATQKEQCRNKRNTLFVDFRGIKIPLVQLCEEIGVEYNKVWRRLFYYDWPLEEALMR